MKGISTRGSRIIGSIQVKDMNVSKKYKARVIGKSIGTIRSAKQALYAAAALHTIAPMLLLTCLVIPLVVSAHG
jgi:hypothetical protein